jgi:hypothetical protein
MRGRSDQKDAPNERRNDGFDRPAADKLDCQRSVSDRLAEVTTERAVVVVAAPWINWLGAVAVRRQGVAPLMMRAGSGVLVCGSSAHNMVIAVRVSPCADDGIGHLQGNRERGDQSVRAAKHGNPFLVHEYGSNEYDSIRTVSQLPMNCV